MMSAPTTRSGAGQAGDGGWAQSSAASATGKAFPVAATPGTFAENSTPLPASVQAALARASPSPSVRTRDAGAPPPRRDATASAAPVSPQPHPSSHTTAPVVQ
jgi:hypothetical protein